MLMSNEKWIDGFENRYSVCTNGFVYSHNFSNTNIKKRLKTSINSNGYGRVTLRLNGIPKTYRVHRLILSTFKGYDEVRKYVNHIDGNKLNNKLSNLEWVTPKENIDHAWDNKLCKGISKKGRDTVLQILDGVIINEFNGIVDASINTGLHASNISDVCNNGRQITCGGFEWKFKGDYCDK